MSNPTNPLPPKTETEIIAMMKEVADYLDTVLMPPTPEMRQASLDLYNAVEPISFYGDNPSTSPV